LAACPTCKGVGLIAAKEPCPGHATAKEACEHYRQYLLGKLVISGPKPIGSWPKEKCAYPECQREGTYLANIPGTMSMCWEMCPDHAGHQFVAELVKVGESWHS
jgi:hypothetical protein